MANLLRNNGIWGLWFFFVGTIYLYTITALIFPEIHYVIVCLNIVLREKVEGN